MKFVFSQLTRLSLRFRLITLLLMLVISAAGVIAVTQLKVELIPSVSFPQTIILAQASGMTGEQVLTIVTERVESALNEIPEIVNLESTTTGGFGAVITARNNFGDNQARVQADVEAALDTIWLPTRRIAPPAGETPEAFAARLLGDLTPDVLIYLAERDTNFLFQLSPDVWTALSPETVEQLVVYLAGETRDTNGNALTALVEQEIIPALEVIPQVANVTISGGQILPGEGDTPPTETTGEATSLLLDLSPEVWAVVSEKLPNIGALNAETAEALRESSFEIPTTPPTLPESWQMDRFVNASDLVEMQTLTRTLSAVFNQFAETGRIVGALGQTNDLTVADVEQMLALDPTMVEYFTAEHLVSMSDDVFAVLPDAYLADLDGFTRDELAATALAAALTGEEAQPDPVDLPQAWRIQPPQLITFSFDDLPLATFSIGGTAPEMAAAVAPTETPAETEEGEPASVETVREDIPEGPSLPFAFGLLGTFLGIELNTADDLINIQLPENLAAQFGGDSLGAGQLLSFLLLLDNPDALPEGTPSIPLPGGAAGLIGQISPEAISFIAEYDETFLPTLSPEVFDAFSDDVLALPQVTPPLNDVWNTLANQPQFADAPLNTAQDILELGEGSAAATLNTLNASIPEQFAGYEVRLFDSLSPATIRYFTLQEPDFFSQLDANVLLKLSPKALALVPQDVLTSLPDETAEQLNAIASGEVESAAQAQAALYATNVPPADPDAPALNADWQFIGDFIGVELDTADDFFRFFPNVPNFLNSFFDSAQGASFAPNLFGNLSAEALAYMVERQPDLLDELRIEALQLLTDDVVTTLPDDVQERIASGGTPFVPTAAVTRLDGSPSLNLTIYKTQDANNVEAFHIVEEALAEIDAENDNITVSVAFEQASFVEESINGVAREGGLGAVFAVIVILVFLSSGRWSRRPRAIVGAVMVAMFIGILFLITSSTAASTGLDFAAAFEQVDVVVRVLLIAGIIIGLLVIVFPGKLPYPAWRSTLVTAVSIPLSVLMALALMRWLPGTVHNALIGGAEDASIIAFILRLFPESITLNIMTLSGLTVAIGRVVDDSIVVLENIFRQVQAGGDKRTAIITGTRDVSVAIFAATVITVVVFLPLGLTGGIIGEFFLPFGLAVTYSLMASFLVAITVVPVMAYLLLDEREIAHEEEGALERAYLPALRWALANGRNKAIVLALAALSLVVGGALLASRPQAFLPAFGEPQIAVSIELPSDTKIVETNEIVTEFEAYLASLPEGELGTISTVIGSGGGLESLVLGSSGVSENVAQITAAVEDQSLLNALTPVIRAEAERIFGEENVTVSAASLSEQGFGGFALVMAGPQAELEALNEQVIATINDVEGIANASSSLAQVGAAGGGGSQTFIRIDGESAVRFTAELESSDTLGVTSRAIAAVEALPNLPDTVTISEGFETRQQTEGFASLASAMGIAIVIVVVVLIVTFGSLVHWLDIILSIIVAPVGAAILLTLTDRVLGISAMIGLLMLIGIVVTNAVVLIDRVLANQRERGMNTHDALIEAGGRRLRPILMTAVATICALIPLAIGLSEGAIIASELGTVVIGGLFSSTLLTLIVVPVAYSLLEGRGEKRAARAAGRQRPVGESGD